MTVKSFQICVSDDVLNDLRRRLARTRFTVPSDTVFWAAGTDPGYLRDLVTYWGERRPADSLSSRSATERDGQFPATTAGREVTGEPEQPLRT